MTRGYDDKITTNKGKLTPAPSLGNKDQTTESGEKTPDKQGDRADRRKGDNHGDYGDHGNHGDHNDHGNHDYY